MSRRNSPPRHACRFTVNTKLKTRCPYGCGGSVDVMGCENPACTSTAPGYCLCQMPDY